jgi:hypothetical protein
MDGRVCCDWAKSGERKAGSLEQVKLFGGRKVVEESVQGRCAGCRGVGRVVGCMQAADIAGKTRLPSGQCIQTSMSRFHVTRWLVLHACLILSVFSLLPIDLLLGVNCSLPTSFRPRTARVCSQMTYAQRMPQYSVSTPEDPNASPRCLFLSRPVIWH